METSAVAPAPSSGIDLSRFHVPPDMLALIGVIKGVGADDTRLSSVVDDVGEIKGRLGDVERRLSNVETDMADVKARLGGVENRLGGLEGEVKGLGKEVTALAASFKTSHNMTIAFGAAILAGIIGLIGIALK